MRPTRFRHILNCSQFPSRSTNCAPFRSQRRHKHAVWGGAPRRSDGALERWPSSTPRKHCDHSICRPPLWALAKCSFLIRLWQNCLDSFGTRGSKLTKAGALRPVRVRDGSLLPGAPASPPLRIAGVRTTVHADFCEMREPPSPEGHFAYVLGQPIIIVLLHCRVDNVLPLLRSSVDGEDAKAMFAGCQVDRCVKLRRR